MAVEFLTDEQAAGYGAFHGAPSRAELERYFFLDDADLELARGKRRAHNRLGFAVQLTSARYLGRFRPDPRQKPAEVAQYLAEQCATSWPSLNQACSPCSDRSRTARLLLRHGETDISSHPALSMTTRLH